jgi:TetR/AcrR family transcriptional regulator, transcriptional repressor for nem operon
MARPISYDPDAALDRAMDLFWERGYRSVSVDDLVHQTGLNRHSLYGQYGSKYGLACAALRRYCDESLVRLHAVLNQTGTPTERVSRFLHLRAADCTDAWWRNMLERGCFALRMATEMKQEHPEIGTLVSGTMGKLLDELAGVIRDGQTRGEFRADRAPESLAVVLYSAWIAALLMPPDPEREHAVLSVLT